MSPSRTNPRALRFGPFELDLETGELRRSGLKLRLQEQAFRVLAALVLRPGELLSRDELRRALWPDTVFVDQEHGLNIAVAKLRRALRDPAHSPRYVETIERRGYRFIAPVEPIAPPAVPASPAGKRPPRLVRVVWGRRSIALDEGVHLVGRNPSSTIWIDSPQVSRRHVSITVDESSVTVEDLGSRNGTLVCGEPVSAPRVVRDGDVVTVGQARLVVRTESPSGTTQVVRRHPTPSAT
jgi:DNA-binding winged helix-turn-helix (wHTH) protein